MSYNHDAVIKKMDRLRSLVMFKIADYKSHPDYIWSCRMLDDVKDSGLVPNKIEFTMANLIWKKFKGGVGKDNDTLWSLVDTFLVGDNRSKISAIKMLRRFANMGLREAKEAVDARDYGLKNGWDV